MNATAHKLLFHERHSDPNPFDASYRIVFASLAMNYVLESDYLDDCDRDAASVPHIYRREDSHKIVYGHFVAWRLQL